MRKLKLAMYVSLDGVVEEPAWTGPFWNDELADLQAAYLYSSDALVLGRVTYEGFAASWPSMEEQTGDFGRKMNSMPKHVATTTLSTPEWNATFLQGEVADAVAKLKTEPGNLLINGSASLVNYLTKHNLIDEYRIMIFPVVQGEGRKLWDEGTRIALTLADSWRTTTGVEVVTYVPA